MNIVLAADGPLDAGATLARYHLWGEDPANRLDGAVFRRVLRFGGRLWPYEARATGAIEEARIEVRVAGARSADVAADAAAEVRRIFGLDFDLPGFYRMAK